MSNVAKLVLLRASSKTRPGFAKEKPTKLQHWRGFRTIFARKGPPVLGFEKMALSFTSNPRHSGEQPQGLRRDDGFLEVPRNVWHDYSLCRSGLGPGRPTLKLMEVPELPASR
jgi:hypothetical protein